MKFRQLSVIEIPCLQCFQSLISGDLKWPLTSTKNNMLFVVYTHTFMFTYIPNMRSVQDSLLDISCLQRFHSLTWTVDLKWPLTSIKNNRLLILSVIQLHTKYAICSSVPSWDIFYCFPNLTPVDPKWTLTSTKNNRLLAINVVQLHTKYEMCPSFPSCNIMFTRFSQFDPRWLQMTFDLHHKQ